MGTSNSKSEPQRKQDLKHSAFVGSSKTVQGASSHDHSYRHLQSAVDRERHSNDPVTNIVITTPKSSEGETVVKITSSKSQSSDPHRSPGTVKYHNKPSEFPEYRSDTVFNDKKPAPTAPPLTEIESHNVAANYSAQNISSPTNVDYSSNHPLAYAPQVSNAYKTLPAGSFNHIMHQPANVQMSHFGDTPNTGKISGKKYQASVEPKIETSRNVGTPQSRTTSLVSKNENSDAYSKQNLATANIVNKSSNLLGTSSPVSQASGIYPVLPPNLAYPEQMVQQLGRANQHTTLNPPNNNTDIYLYNNNNNTNEQAFQRINLPTHNANSNNNFSGFDRSGRDTNCPRGRSGQRFQRGKGKRGINHNRIATPGFSPDLSNQDKFQYNSRDNRTNRGSGYRGHGNSGNRNRGRGANYKTNLQRNAPGSMESVMSNESNLSNENGSVGTNLSRQDRRMQIGYKRLVELAEKDPHEAIKVVANRQSGFYDLMFQNLKPDWLLLVMTILSNICRTGFQENKVAILVEACKPKFLEQLTLYMSSLPVERNSNRKAGIESLICDLITFYTSVMELLPTTACDSLSPMLIRTEVAMNAVTQYLGIEFSEDTTKKFKNLNDQLKMCISNQQVKLRKDNFSAEDNVEPPNNFREISVFPTADDILTDCEPFIRRIIAEGAYTDVDHYLDIQFRLLREDFVRPLREGIGDYLTGNNKKIRNIRLYSKTKFLHPTVVSDRIGFTVCFDPEKRMQKQRFYSKRRLMFGSLLCFSDNKFKDILFATVLENDEKYLREGQIVVQIISNGNYSKDEICNGCFVMVESKVYFEPYQHVLRALQLMQADDFPLPEYIISVENLQNPPDYLVNELGMSKNLSIGGKIFQALQPELWPNSSTLKLDESQYIAFKMALTEKFVVIQGPPGTGKTYIGLKIMGVLLQHPHLWKSENSPILVICYTNHALDQFLEGLLQFTSNIVRVGGQSKNEQIKPLNLREKRKTIKRSGATYRMFNEMRKDLSVMAAKIKKIEKSVEVIDNNSGILSVEVLEQCMSEMHSRFFINKDSKLDNDIFIRWLEDGMDSSASRSREESSSAPMHETNSDTLTANDFEDDDEIETDSSKAMKIDDDLGLDEDVYIPEQINLALDFETIASVVNELKDAITKCENEENDVVFNIRWDLEQRLEMAERRLKYYQNNLSSENKLPIQPLLNSSNLWNVNQSGRWALYKHWVEIVKNRLFGELRDTEIVYSSRIKQFEEVKLMEDYEVLRQAYVIGMTTTGAARLQPLLQALKCKIVIVEEAAEVLESHIVVALTRHCQHLILIGDHQQLRPSTSVYQLREKFNLDVSLFERMLKNGFHCETLKVQHRMRPEIASLIVPAIYPKLINHDSVHRYEHISGIKSNMFFVTHHEGEETVSDMMSFVNKHEGDFLISLCRHLILQGYSPQDIVILTAYAGQALYIQKKRRAEGLLKDVKVICVDNFQGEESKIILLSFVRSNEDNNVGFLKIENRVCVALSRAREGFYMIGNMDCLTAASALWQKINEVLISQRLVGPYLSLKCQRHQDQITQVSRASDFVKVPEGGCRLLCNELLPCGHKCTRICHILDREHKSFKCMKPCERIPEGCRLEHRCQKRCFEDCGDCEFKIQRFLTCGHKVVLACHLDPKIYQCTEIVVTNLPCGHSANKPCHRDLSTFPCPHPCENRLPCGHQCERKCHIKDDPDHLKYKCFKPCARKNLRCRKDHICQKKCHEECSVCEVTVKRALPQCGHVHDVTCSQDDSEIICKRNCKRILPCGHHCKLRCYEQCGNCKVEVDKVISKCRHTIKEKCSVVPNPNKCRKPCERILPCGHKCTKLCGQDCETECKKKVLMDKPAVCGHRIMISCYQKKLGTIPEMSLELLSLCEAPCKATLECGHKCHGTCGSCFQGCVHRRCQEKCERLLVCGHKCEVPCSENCPPCNKSCTHRCSHSRCSNKCGEPCTPCKERCTWKCEHFQCTKQCYDLCDREPCYRPCKQKLSCGHPCIGFCGEPCSPLCRICNMEEVTTIVFGYEDDEDARFVYLEDCKHTLESRGLETWLQTSQEEVKLLVCPLCKTPITRTQRYMNQIKNVLVDICKVKTKAFGILEEIKRSRSQLNNELAELTSLSSCVITNKKWLDYLDHLRQQLLPVRGQRRNPLSQMDTESLGCHIRFLKEIIHIIRTSNGLDKNSFEKIEIQVMLILTILRSRERYLSSQEIEDISCELDRFNALVQLYKLESTPIYKANCNKMLVQQLHNNAQKTVFSLIKFSPDQKKIFLDSLSKLNHYLKDAIVILNEERKQVMKALNLKQGHWYKCPNGHVYVITDCGRAMEIGRCNECGAQIGGTRHRLLQSNSVATEMSYF